MDLNELKEKINAFFEKLPFKKLAEKIPTEARAKVSVLDKVIPFANQIVCGLAVVLVITVIACSGKGGNSSGGSSSSSKASIAPASDFEYDLTKDGKGVMIIKYKGPGGNIIVPSEIEGMPVLELGRGDTNFTNAGYVFDSTRVTSVVLPDTLVTLMPNAFSDTPLQQITFPQGIIEVPYQWFRNTKSLKTIDIPDTVKAIGGEAFRYSGLTSVVIPEGVTTICDGAFDGCKDLKSVALPESIKMIGSRAFGGCVSLETVNLPSHSVFYGSLSPVWIDRDSRLLGEYQSGMSGGVDAFEGCTSLSLVSRKAIQDSGYTGSFAR
jgi:hypothetical protein